MAGKEEEFLQKLLATFAAEAEERLIAIAAQLFELEKTAAAEKRKVLIETLFREAHSLKGAARAANADEVETVCKSLENVFAAVTRADIVLSPELFDLLHQAVACLRTILAADAGTRGAAEHAATDALCRQLDAATHGEPQPSVLEKDPKLESGAVAVSAAPTTPANEPAPTVTQRLPASAAAAQSVRVSTAKLDALMRRAEELVSIKLTAGRYAGEARALAAELAAWRKTRERTLSHLPALRSMFAPQARGSRTARPAVDAARIAELTDLNEQKLQALSTRAAAIAAAFDDERRSIAKMVDNVIEDAKQVLMLPFSSLLELFPGLVRDLARGQGKDIELSLRGADIEVDRRILEEIKDPLLHLVRNCIDHGIEKPAERKRRNKPARGTITIAVSQKDAGKIEIAVSDDGAGIDTARVRSAALKLGIVAPAEAAAMGEREAMLLAFRSGVTTSPIVTDISGRGLGLAIVQEKVEKLGGATVVESVSGAGTAFRIQAPVTLAAFRGVVVRAGERRFALPTANVEQVARVRKSEIQTVENRETVRINARTLAVARLEDVLDLPRNRSADRATGYAQLIVVTSRDQRMALLVDEILGEQEVLVKGLGKQLARVRNIAGATILGGTALVPILNVADLLQSAIQAAGALARPAAAEEAGMARRKTVMVVEDSITARALLRNILEGAGYEVKTAVDGADALARLNTEEVNLVVSDVQMPRMDGFDLTAKIRGDAKLAELPVVLVTALESREDREHGIDVGANAYIVKRSFDQSNLLDVIAKLI